jgi:hypothetical protein
MQLEWLYYPITQYTLTGVGILSSLTLWAGARAELRGIRRTLKTELAQLETGVTTLTSSLDDVRKAHHAVPQEPSLPPAPPPLQFLQGLNLTKRTQILRMKRRGESLNSIAAALQLPAGEVSLILKMDSLQTPENQFESPQAPAFAKAAARGIL